MHDYPPTAATKTVPTNIFCMYLFVILIVSKIWIRDDSGAVKYNEIVIAIYWADVSADNVDLPQGSIDAINGQIQSSGPGFI